MNTGRLHLGKGNMAITSKSKNKVVACSTPESQHRHSPTRDSDSESASPIPFLCTQDGTDGETDVVWNYYTPKSDHNAISRLKNSTPLSSKHKKSIKPKVLEKSLPKRRALRTTQKNTQLFQDLIELNQNIHKFIEKKPSNNNDSPLDVNSGSEDDIFTNSNDCSPKSGLKMSSRCLRKNLLSAKLSKPEFETALESDDSMNECLFKVSQMVEENILSCLPKKTVQTDGNFCNYSDLKKDSMDAILNNITLESPVTKKSKKYESPKLQNDSFDNFVSNLNDSALEQLTQMSKNKVTPIQTSKGNRTLTEVNKIEGSPSSKLFSRHNSMPDSPSRTDVTKPSTSGMFFGRHNSFPYKNPEQDIEDTSPIRCTPDEIKRKHQQAREKLLAKRLPFTSSSQYTQYTQKTSQQGIRANFKLKVPSSNAEPSIPVTRINSMPADINNTVNRIETKVKPTCTKTDDVKMLIEKKRQEALLKLRKRQMQNKN